MDPHPARPVTVEWTWRFTQGTTPWSCSSSQPCSYSTSRNIIRNWQRQRRNAVGAGDSDNTSLVIRSALKPVGVGTLPEVLSQ